MSAFDLYARPPATFDAKVELARRAAPDAELHGATRAVRATSPGVEDMVVTDLLHCRAGLPTRWTATLDTQALHAETLALDPADRGPLRPPVTVFSPAQEAVVHFVRQQWRARHVRERRAAQGPARCARWSRWRMLAGRSAWITGPAPRAVGRREDAAAVEKDAQGRDKVSPPDRLDAGRRGTTSKLHAVPYNPLHDQFFPLHRLPAPPRHRGGRDFRASRWWWGMSRNAAKSELRPALRQISRRPAGPSLPDEPNLIANPIAGALA